MATTPALIRKDIAARLASAGMREATGPLGASSEPATVIDRSFDVVMGDDEDDGQRVVPGVSIRVKQAITVRIAHKVKPRAAGEAQDQSLADRTAAMRVMFTRTAVGDPRAATAAQYENTIGYGGATTESHGGGAFLLTTLRFGVVYQLDLTAGVA